MNFTGQIVKGFRTLLLSAGIFLLFTLSAHAIPSATNMPKGVRAGAFVYGFGNGIDDKFNSFGRLESLVSPLNRSLSIEDLVEFEPELEKLQYALNSLGPGQYGDNLLLVDIYQDLEVSEARYVTGLVWGFTDTFALGLIVPVMNRSYKANFRVETVNNAAELRERLGDIPQLEAALQEVQETNLDANMFAQEIFDRHGYSRPEDFNASGLGDIELEARYQYYNSGRVVLQFRPSLKIPTATYEPDIRNLFDRPLGQNHYSLRLGSYHDLKIVPDIFSINSAAGITLHAPNREIRAVKKDPEQLLPDLTDPDQIEDVRRQTGTDFSWESGAMVDFWKGVLSLSSTYVFNYHFEDHYSGDRNLHYAELMENTEWHTHAVETGIALSSIPLYLDKKFPIPATLSFSWTQPLAGRNTEFTPFGRMDLVLLF